MLEYSYTSINDADKMIELFKEFLNSGDPVREYMIDGLNIPGYIGVKCMDGDKMAGVISARPGIEFTFGHEYLAELIVEHYPDAVLYTGDMITVRPEYRGLHIAEELSKRLRTGLKELGATHMMVETWLRDKEKDEPASGILKYLGSYHCIGTYPHFYKDLHKYGLLCPECGEDCKCGARVGVLTL